MKTKHSKNILLYVLTFLLLNGVVVSCDSCKSDKEKLEAEEKILMDKLKKSFKPQSWKKLELTIKEAKNNKLEIEQGILDAKEDLILVDKVVKGQPISVEDIEGLENYLKSFQESIR